jgi:hypothetical protein
MVTISDPANVARAARADGTLSGYATLGNGVSVTRWWHSDGLGGVCRAPECGANGENHPSPPYVPESMVAPIRDATSSLDAREYVRAGRPAQIADQPTLKDPAQQAVKDALAAQDQAEIDHRHLTRNARRQEWQREHGVPLTPNRHNPNQPSRSRAARREEARRYRARKRGEAVPNQREVSMVERLARKLGWTPPES